MSYKDIEKCDCGRSHCHFVDHTEESSISYTTNEIEELIEELEEGLKNLKALLK